MDFRYLKAFIVSAEQGSFSKAAEELNIAQSAVSRQVKLLEESVHDELLIRSSKHLTLTNKGKLLYEALKHFQQETSRLLKDGERSLIRIGIPHGLLESWFQLQIAAYYQQADHNLDILVADLPDLKDGLEAGKFELIFTPYEIDSEKIISRACLKEQFHLVAGHAIDPEKLSDYRWIVYSQGDPLFQLTKKHPRRLIQVNSMTAILKLVKQGLGIAVLPDHLLKGESGLFQYPSRKLAEQMMFASYLRYRKIPESLKTLLAILPDDASV